ncbi:MAG TPA: thiosulfate oxidation carrier protein SoxY [Hyphomicrobiaceae bacterium]|jgi:sulfur-oxidizing protein SoxY|nr:thiosulfate oxidation carrier protein SoxY [Hyphomicrobiaceae bacterium]
MMRTLKNLPIDRRTFARGAAATAAALTLARGPAFGQDKPQPWEAELKKVIGDAKPAEGKLKLEMPEIAENGNTVPFQVSVESAMTGQDTVKAIHIISTANPQADVATFHFTPLSGKPAVASRMRLARTQDVIAVAEMGDGTFQMAKRNVKVTIGGCGG